jgi:exodeoxyribonuclease VII large subunit
MLFTNEPLTVSELTKQIKINLEEGFPQLRVIGEISNFKRHVSGHWYFNLKDSNAVISCTMWKGLNSMVFFTPGDGMKIIVNGRLTVYPPRGSYQIDVRSMQPAGIGELQAAFEKLKQKLSEEGLFDEEHKKPIPEFPEKIGIVTAIDGAAFRDMISVAKRRYPLIELIIAPAKVQGSGAAKTIVESINQLNRQKNIDVIIVGRGGGSIEDLWAFNEEIVTRAIYHSKIPIISGVGHEIDFTIADFVSDLRAPTPSAAMELATPNQDDLIDTIEQISGNLDQTIRSMLDEKQDKIRNVLNSYGFRIPIDILRRDSQILDNLIYKVNQALNRIYLFKSNKFYLISNRIESHDVNRLLKKGFALVKQNAAYITRAKDFLKNKDVFLKFFDGEVHIKNDK